jgi:hypothetical protein
MVLGFGLDMAIVSTTGGVPAVRQASLGADLVRVAGSAIWPVEGWTYTLMIVPACAFLPALHRRLWKDEDADLSGTALVALAAFWVVHTLHNTVILGVVQGLAPAYVPGAADAASVEASARGLVGVSDALFGPGSGLGTPLLALASLAYGLRMGKTRAFAAWVAPAAFGSAAFSLVGMLQFAFAPLLFVGLIGWILFIAWTAGASLGLLRPGPATEAPAAAGAGA